jgi:hypothetical protein
MGRPVDINLAIRHVPAGAVPWTLRRGSTFVNAAGQFSLTVRGLLITGTNTSLDGTTGPVTSVIPTLTCRGMPPTLVTTPAIPLSPEGDARVHGRVALPPTCLAPIVLVRANLGDDPWIATSGF